MENDTLVTIRPVEREDAEEVCKICCEDLGYQCDKYLVSERISQLDAEREAVFVAVLGGEVVGFIHVDKYITLYFEAMVNILGLAVRGKCRRHGVGKALLEAAEGWAIEHEITLVRLNSGSSRSGAHDFYRSMGYSSEKDQIRFLKRVEYDWNETE